MTMAMNDTMMMERTQWNMKTHANDNLSTLLLMVVDMGISIF